MGVEGVEKTGGISELLIPLVLLSGLSRQARLPSFRPSQTH